MWPLLTGAVFAVLAIALVLTNLYFRRREDQHLARAHELLRERGEDGLAPQSLGAALDRLGHLAGETSETPRHGVSQDQLVSALNEVPIGVVLSDAAGAVVVRNKVAQPYERGRHGEALVEAVVQARLADAVRGQATDEEFRLHGPPERAFFVVGTPLTDENGTVTGAVVLVDDVSDQHRVDAVRRDFVANVSHELRTPVGAISLLAETLEGETDPDVVERFVARMQDETSRLSRLIDDLLDLSRIEGRTSGDPAEPVSLATVVSESVGAIRGAADHKQIILRTTGEDSAGRVLGHHSDLVSAVTNLLENAVKYTPEGGRVDCHLSTVDDEATIAVMDDGIGIPRKDLQRIFERFYRVDRGRSSKSGGTGLGLSIARHVAVEHGGRIEVDSYVGSGSTFTIVLPLDSTSGIEASTGSSDRPNTATAAGSAANPSNAVE